MIVAVYNAERYLRQCVASVLAQSFSCLELLLVDDGSDDTSPRICDELAASDSRIRVIHRPNGGPSAARNSGLDMARGEYVAFVDSDDMISRDFIADMLSLAEGSDRTTDGGKTIACCGHIPFRDKIPGKRAAARPPKVMSGREAVISMLYQTAPPDCSVWGKLFPGKLFSGIRFREGIIYEDLDIIYLLMLRADSVAVTGKPLYYYRISPGSLIHSFSRRRTDVIGVTEHMENHFTTISPDEELRHAARHRRFSGAFNVFGLVSAHGGDATLAYRCWATVRELRKEILLNPRSRLKNRIGALISYIGGRRISSLISAIIYR